MEGRQMRIVIIDPYVIMGHPIALMTECAIVVAMIILTMWLTAFLMYKLRSFLKDYFK